MKPFVPGWKIFVEGRPLQWTECKTTAFKAYDKGAGVQGWAVQGDSYQARESAVANGEGRIVTKGERAKLKALFQRAHREVREAQERGTAEPESYAVLGDPITHTMPPRMDDSAGVAANQVAELEQAIATGVDAIIESANIPMGQRGSAKRTAIQVYADELVKSFDEDCHKCLAQLERTNSPDQKLFFAKLGLSSARDHNHALIKAMAPVAFVNDPSVDEENEYCRAHKIHHHKAMREVWMSFVRGCLGKERAEPHPEDLIKWPDGTTCFRSELGEMCHMSDDYEVVPVDSPNYDSESE